MTDFTKGQQVTFNSETRGDRGAGYGSRLFARNSSAEVTAVRRLTITVRHEATGYSYNVPRTSLKTPNGEVWTPPVKVPPRKLGTPPEGGISPDDPRIAYLWEDAAKLANRLSFCGEYDQITEKLGIPGRERDIDVSIKINGIDVRTTVKARSKNEAEALVKEKLGAE